MKYKVKNMLSNNGNKIPNQFIINTTNKKIFQSYNTIIAIIDYKNNKTYLDCNKWDYSTTTSKYRNIFLNEKTKDTLKKIKNKEYILKNLNN
tara:strand:- start:337 stop:612 length:276 start_codon:yes stop_codon:yes gene_type:complete